MISWNDKQIDRKRERREQKRKKWVSERDCVWKSVKTHCILYKTHTHTAGLTSSSPIFCSNMSTLQLFAPKTHPFISYTHKIRVKGVNSFYTLHIFKCASCIFVRRPTPSFLNISSFMLNSSLLLPKYPKKYPLSTITFPYRYDSSFL